MKKLLSKLKTIKMALSGQYELVDKRTYRDLERKSKVFDMLQESTNKGKDPVTLSVCLDDCFSYLVIPQQELERISKRSYEAGVEEEKKNSKRLEEAWLEEKQRRLELMKLIKD